MRGVLVFDVSEFEECLPPLSFGGFRESAVEQCCVALGLEVAQEPARIVAHPDPSVLPASAAAGSFSWYFAIASATDATGTSP